jgi:hypothetical protein
MDHLGLPAARQLGHLALRAQPIAQVDQHRLADGPLDAEAGT